MGLGVSYETADMHHIDCGSFFTTALGYFTNLDEIDDKYYPCWSLNALISLFAVGNDAPVFTLTRCGTDIKTEQHNNDWYAEWEDDKTYLVFNDVRAVGAVIKLIEKLVKDYGVNYLKQ